MVNQNIQFTVGELEALVYLSDGQGPRQVAGRTARSTSAVRLLTASLNTKLGFHRSLETAVKGRDRLSVLDPPAGRALTRALAMAPIGSLGFREAVRRCLQEERAAILGKEHQPTKKPRVKRR